MVGEMCKNGAVEKMGDVIGVGDEVSPDLRPKFGWDSIDDGPVEIGLFEVWVRVLSYELPKH